MNHDELTSLRTEASTKCVCLLMTSCEKRQSAPAYGVRMNKGYCIDPGNNIMAIKVLLPEMTFDNE